MWVRVSARGRRSASHLPGPPLAFARTPTRSHLRSRLPAPFQEDASRLTLWQDREQNHSVRQRLQRSRFSTAPQLAAGQAGTREARSPRPGLRAGPRLRCCKCARVGYDGPISSTVLCSSRFARLASATLSYAIGTAYRTRAAGAGPRPPRTAKPCVVS